MLQTKPDREAFEKVCKRFEGLNPFTTEPLNCKDVIDVFGWPAVELYLLCITSDDKKHQVLELLKDIKRSLR